MDAGLDPRRVWGPEVREGGTTFRLWAPAAQRIDLVADGRAVPMEMRADGWFEADVAGPMIGKPYFFRLEDGREVADPASRRQLAGLEGPSVVTDPQAYRWKTGGWKGRPWEEAVLYELHVGTFTGEGTFAAAIAHLPRLAAMGFTDVEIMPVAHFTGERGWGYDGVLHYAPHAAYGTPEDFKAFVDAAHGLGLMVMLDVVYNHFGPVGNYLGCYAPDFFRPDDHTPWGQRIAYEIPAVRRYFIDNVLYWLDEFRLDGLRFDAVDEIEDRSDPHILKEIAVEARRAHADRPVHLMMENPASGTGLLQMREDGMRLYTADWDDVFHHALHVGMTGEVGENYKPFASDPWGVVRRSLARSGQEDGEDDLPPTAFVHYLQNHDQVGNRARGDRLHASLDRRRYAVATELLLLSPQVPLFFMGEDHLSSRPFCYFADYEGEHRHVVKAHRPREARNFGDLPEDHEDIADPTDPETFHRSKLDWAGDEAWTRWLTDLIGVRREKIVPLLAGLERHDGDILPGGAEGVVSVDWRLGARRLRIRANLSASPAPLPGGEGAPFYRTRGTRAEGPLEPWSLRAYLH